MLVVGGGNTGYQIAEELAGSHEAHISIGSRQTPLPQRILGRDLFWYLDKTGLIRKTTASRIGRRLQQREDTLIGSSPRGLRLRGVEFHPRAVGAAGSTVTFSDGGKLDVRSVIWATGFRDDHSWIHVPVFDESGRVVHQRGVTNAPGLYFLGLPWQHTRGSALLGFVKDDADYLAQQINAFGQSATREAPVHERSDDRAPRTDGPRHDHQLRPRESTMSTTPDHFPTDTTGLPEARAASWSSCPTVISSSCGSLRSPSGSATRRCGCWPTTARSPDRP